MGAWTGGADEGFRFLDRRMCCTINEMTTDGKMFDSSLQRGQPSEFQLNGLIRGWTEGVQMMVEGEKRRFWIPEQLAYKGSPDKPQGMLVFDIELLDIR